MSKWTEVEIRKEATWQAFKEGKSLFERGAVSDLRVKDGLVTALVRQGKRRFRTVIRTKDRLEVECQCRENRQTGAVCAHAVATLLAALEPAAISETPAPEETTAPAAPVEVIPLRVEFPGHVSKALSRGRLSARLEQCDGELHPADESLARWLAQYAPDLKLPGMLALPPDLLGSFLEALAGHPRLAQAGGGLFQISSDPLPLLQPTNSEYRNKSLLIEHDGETCAFAWGDQIGWVRGEVMAKAPVAVPSERWRAEAIDLLTGKQIRLPLDDFLSNAGAWMDLLGSSCPGWLSQISFRTRPVKTELHLEGSLNAIDARLSDQDTTGRALLEEGDTLVMENHAGRSEAQTILTQVGFQGGAGDWRLRDADAITVLLADRLDDLRKHANVVIGERLRHVMKSLHVIRPRIDFGSSGSLSCEISFQTDGEKVVPRSKVIEMLRSGRKSVKTRSGAQVVLSSVIEEEFEPLVSELGIGRPDGRVQLDQARQEALRAFAGEDRTPPEAVASALGQATLRDYQQYGANWILDRLKQLRGAVLADEMGLGKTLQSLAVLNEDGDGPNLVIVPTSLLANWRSEIERFTPDKKLVLLHGQGRDELRSQVADADIVLTSYGTMCRDLAFHLQQSYQTLVLDEASLLRNPKSETTRSVAKLRTRRRLALTGTPVENHLTDLWTLFQLISPGYLGEKDDFKQRYDSSSVPDLTRLRHRTAPFVLRRTKDQVAKDLPDKIVMDQWLEFDPGTRSLYREIATAGLGEWEKLQESGQTGVAEMHLLTTLLRLRQVCLDPWLATKEENPEFSAAKMTWLKGVLEERAKENRKTLVFSQFNSFLRKNRSSLEALDLGAIYHLDGSTRNRGAVVDAFQSHDGPAVFLISLKAGGYGLNLTAADCVVHLDPWWNPAVEAQATDRAHRIGQKRPVSVYRLLMKDSVEERVRRLQQSKAAMIDALEGRLPALNQQEVRDLIF